MFLAEALIYHFGGHYVQRKKLPVLYASYQPALGSLIRRVYRIALFENGFERTHLIGWRSTVPCSLWPTSCWLRHQRTV